MPFGLHHKINAPSQLAPAHATNAIRVIPYAMGHMHRNVVMMTSTIQARLTILLAL